MFNNNNHIFKLNNKPLKNYPYPFHLSYCPIKSCCNDEYAKLNANNIFCKVNTFNNKVVINSGNLQVKDLASFPSTSPGFGNYASVNGTPYFYDSITNTWINLLENAGNKFSIISNPGIVSVNSSNIIVTTFTIDIPNIYGQLFNYQATIIQPPLNIDFSLNEVIQLANNNYDTAEWGVSSGVGIFVPYTVDGAPGNGAYVFNAYSHPGFGNFTGLQKPATTNITGTNTYTTIVDGDYSQRQFVLNGTIQIPFIN
jgi:hypothetical protein